MAFRLRMNLQLFAGEKTEEATPQKRREARKEGQVAKSIDIPGSAIMLGGIACLMIFGGFFLKRITWLFTDGFLHRLSTEITVANVMQMLGQYAMEILIIVSPVFVTVFLLAIITNYAQVGFMLTGKPLMPKLSKLDPIKGFKNIASMRSVVEFLKSVLKMIVIGYLVYSTLAGVSHDIPKTAYMPPESILHFAAGLTASLGLKVGVGLFVLAILDYMYQRYDHNKKLRMSKQDIKDEYKKTEGDPLIKGKIRERQRRMAMQRMMQDVPNADVIITNPTHFAVALKYDNSQMAAPMVVAKGQDFVALRIREVAKQNRVVIMENKPLARALFARTEIGESIPGDLFQAVAEVLAYVYKVKGKTK
ncbi:flagellar biosynthesis protein FlhB [Paenibacillus sp. WLX1005]|uniref:flagellar biosynthesis protein FlhB n=1 Tax=Paenibacillus sp. WLX1005 TaxID=3243766 RepID=UPI0039840859